MAKHQERMQKHLQSQGDSQPAPPEQ